MSKKFSEQSFAEIEAANEKAGYREIDMTAYKGTRKGSSDSDDGNPKTFSPKPQEAHSFLECNMT